MAQFNPWERHTLKIVMDGDPAHTRILDGATGEDLTAKLHCVGVCIEQRQHEPPRAVLDCLASLEFTGPARVAPPYCPAPEIPLLEAFARACRDLSGGGRTVAVAGVPYCDSYGDWRAIVTVDGACQAWRWREGTWQAE